MTELGLTYVVGILPQIQMRMNGNAQALAAEKLAGRLPAKVWRTIAWCEGTAAKLSSRFACVRMRVAHRDALSGAGADEWLLIEWPKGEAKPAKYWLSTLPEDVSFARLVDTAKLRWRIERDYQELKQKVGLGHFEGRGWRGFHHHASLCIASYGFLISERETIPPRDLIPPGASRNLPYPIVIDPAAPPWRTQRHIPNSVATMRWRLIPALVKNMPRCPCCNTSFVKYRRASL